MGCVGDVVMKDGIASDGRRGVGTDRPSMTNIHDIDGFQISSTRRCMVLLFN